MGMILKVYRVIQKLFCAFCMQSIYSPPCSKISSYATDLVTYLSPSGASSTLLHGVLSWDNWQYDGVLNFDEDEWITRVNICSGPSHVVDYLQVARDDQLQGCCQVIRTVWKVFMGNVTTIHGMVYGFFGHYGNQLDVLGFYV